MCPPWAQLLAIDIPPVPPDLPGYITYHRHVHIWFRRRQSAPHRLCAACCLLVHNFAFLAPGSPGSQYIDTPSRIHMCLVGADLAIPHHLTHTFSVNQAGERWRPRIAAAKIGKDVQRGFIQLSSSRPRCPICGKPATVNSLLLVDKDPRSRTFDNQLPAYNRICWNYSAPPGVDVNSWVPIASIPNWINYGSLRRAESAILSMVRHCSVGQVVLCVWDQPAAYRQTAVSREYLGRLAARCPVFVDPKNPSTSPIHVKWLQDFFLNFGFKISGHVQHQNVLFIVFCSTSIAQTFYVRLDLVVATDDFLVISCRDDQDEALRIFKHVNASVGYGLDGKKVDGFGPVSRWASATIWCGVLLSLLPTPTKSAAPGYLAEVRRVVLHFAQSTRASRFEFDSLQGKLMYLAGIVATLRPLIQPVLDFVRQMPPRPPPPRGGRGARRRAAQRELFDIPTSFSDTLTDTLAFIDRFRHYPIRPMIDSTHWAPEAYLCLYSDSQPGDEQAAPYPMAGIFIAGLYTQLRFPPAAVRRFTSAEGRIDNNGLEIHAAIAARILSHLIFPQHLRGRTVTITVLDSSAAKGGLRRGGSRNAGTNHLLRIVSLYAALTDFDICLTDNRAVRVLSEHMSFADALSRNDFAKFTQEVHNVPGGASHIYNFDTPPAIASLSSLDDLLALSPRAWSDGPGDVPDHLTPDTLLKTTGFQHWWRWIIYSNRAHYTPIPGLISDHVPKLTRARVLINFGRWFLHHNYLPGTVVAYISNVVTAHRDTVGFDICDDVPAYRTFMRQLRSAAKHTVNAKTAATLGMLRQAAATAAAQPTTSPIRPATDAAIVAFWGLLRSKEYTSPSRRITRRWQFTTTCVFFFNRHGDPRQATDSDVHAASIFIWRKCDRGKYGQYVPLFPCDTHPDICPVRALIRSVLRSTSTLTHMPAASRPVFCYTDGTFVTRSDVAKAVKAAAVAGGFEARRFSTHSLRRGGAQALQDAGFSEPFIAAYGAWRSSAQQRYVSLAPSSCSSIVALVIQHARFEPKT